MTNALYKTRLMLFSLHQIPYQNAYPICTVGQGGKKRRGSTLQLFPAAPPHQQTTSPHLHLHSLHPHHRGMLTIYSITLHPLKTVDLGWMKRALVVSIHDVTNRLFSHGTSGGGGISPPTSGTPFSGSPGIMTEYWIVRSATWQWSLAFSHFVNRTPSLKCPNFLVDLNGCQNALIFAKKLNGLCEN